MDHAGRCAQNTDYMLARGEILKRDYATENTQAVKLS